MTEFKDMLKYLRKRAGFSQSESKKLGVSPSTIGNYEQGSRKPDFETEEALADIFNVSLDVLRGKSDAPTAIEVKYALELYKKYQALSPDKQAEFQHYLEYLQSVLR